MDSPGNMIIGIGKGTSSLVQGVLSGALKSTTAFAETAGTGLAFLSGDAEYIRKRAQQRQRVYSQRSGIFEGFVSGTDNFLQGVSSGVSGLFKKPIEEAQQDGLVGFFRGVGLGVLGAAVKPVLGVTDGISTMAIGISKEVGNRKTCKRIRPARTFERSSTDSSDMILVPLDMAAIQAQDFVLDRARSNEFEDSFVG
jgi:vacuolar protein sorting-associated protein 13A/C